MRGSIHMALGLLLLAVSAQAQSAAVNLYVEGNEFYRAGDFAQARQRYERAVSSGVSDPRLFYNLGNASYKTGDIGDAIVWYERARRLAPRDEDIQANLRFLRRIKRDQDPPAATGFAGVLERAYLWPTRNEVAVLWLGCLFAAFLTAAWRRWRRLRGVGTGLPVAAVMCLLMGGFALSRHGHDTHRVEAILTAQQGTARSGPASDQTEVFVIHEGTKVIVERNEDGWYLVRLSSGLGGWLPASALTEI